MNLESHCTQPRQIGNYHRTLATLSKKATSCEKVLKYAARGFLALVLAPVEATLQAHDSFKRAREYHARASIAQANGQNGETWKVMGRERVFAAVAQVILALSFLLLTAVGVGALCHINHKLLCEGATLGAEVALIGASIYGLGQVYKHIFKKRVAR